LLAAVIYNFIVVFYFWTFIWWISCRSIVM